MMKSNTRQGVTDRGVGCWLRSVVSWVERQLVKPSVHTGVRPEAGKRASSWYYRPEADIRGCEK